tara:strand:- start:56 stop:481 length:426 start_codon:yes stop_codon:yes gene_type:complete
MSEEKKLQTVVTYDHSKAITGITISTAYIAGIQRILTGMILENEDPAKLPDMFKKFGVVMNLKENEEPKEKIDFTIEESNIYTLFSLIQLFRYLAKEQGLEIYTETEATTEDLSELADLVTKGADVSEKIKDINSKMKVVK